MIRIDRSPTHLLHRASQAVELAFAVGMGSNTLTPRQLLVLMTIEAHEGLSQTDLVNRTSIDRSTMADIVRRLKGKGLVQRRRTKEDARAYAVRLTAEGHRVLSSVLPIATGAERRVLGALPDDRREAFLIALASIVRTLERGSTAA
jgi:MarR family transcriptional regulator, temperature-dependent positive regulator of motility